MPPFSSESTGQADRAYCVEVLTRISRPVLAAMSKGKLHERLPVPAWEKEAKRDPYSALEAIGRTLAGIAPWLELGSDDSDEGRLRAAFIDMARRSLVHATDPSGPDYCNFNNGKDGQPLVDTAFLAEALLRAPNQLWTALTGQEQEQVIAALKLTRPIQPGNNNWVLFASIVEAAIWEFTGTCDLPRLEYGISKMDGWYLGDGTYGDGVEFHWDYYNSYVIQPMLLEVVEVCRKKGHPAGALMPKLLERARRYAEVQERMISPEGTFPVIGRSSVYRFGAFQHLSWMALRNELPVSLQPGAVRGALTAVIRRMTEAAGTFDEQGWLRVGVVGHQEQVRDSYNSTGSFYLCTSGILHLGLPADAPFWSAEPARWTQQRIWAGEEIPADHAYYGE